MTIFSEKCDFSWSYGIINTLLKACFSETLKSQNLSFNDYLEQIKCKNVFLKILPFLYTEARNLLQSKLMMPSTYLIFLVSKNQNQNILNFALSPMFGCKSNSNSS